MVLVYGVMVHGPNILKCICDNHYDTFKKGINMLRNLTWKIIENHEKAIAADAKQNPKEFWHHTSAASPYRHGIPDLIEDNDTESKKSRFA